MQMLSKLKAKNNRAKSLPFHPKRSWVHATSHTTQICTAHALLEHFGADNGPTPGNAFPPCIELFMSAGYNHRTNAWSYMYITRGCQFVMTGLFDGMCAVYIDHSWIHCSSDDWTIRVWHISVPAGNNRYMMGTQSHPKGNLIVPASLDQPEWLGKKQAVTESVAYNDSRHRASHRADILSNADVVVTSALKGHDCSFVWAMIYPTLLLNVSTSNINQIKLWRMNEARASEVDTCRGHANVSCTISRHRQELATAASGDQRIGICDISKDTAGHILRRQHDRFWALPAHLHLITADHGEDLVVLGFEIKDPACASYQQSHVYTKDDYLCMNGHGNFQETAMISVFRSGSLFLHHKVLSYKLIEQVPLDTTADGDNCKLYNQPLVNNNGSCDLANDAQRDSGNFSILFTCMRSYLVTKKSRRSTIRDLLDSDIKTFKPIYILKETRHAGTDRLSFCAPSSIISHYIQKPRTISKVTIQPFKHVSWSGAMVYVMLVTQHTIAVACKALEQTCLICATFRIKSDAWEEMNTSEHSLKCISDSGIIHMLGRPMHLTPVGRKSDHEDSACTFTTDSVDHAFKLAFIQHDCDETMKTFYQKVIFCPLSFMYLEAGNADMLPKMLSVDCMFRFEPPVNLTVRTHRPDDDVQEDIAAQSNRDVPSRPSLRACRPDCPVSPSHDVTLANGLLSKHFQPLVGSKQSSSASLCFLDRDTRKDKQVQLFMDQEPLNLNQHTWACYNVSCDTAACLLRIPKGFRITMLNFNASKVRIPKMNLLRMTNYPRHGFDIDGVIGNVSWVVAQDKVAMHVFKDQGLPMKEFKWSKVAISLLFTKNQDKSREANPSRHCLVTIPEIVTLTLEAIPRMNQVLKTVEFTWNLIASLDWVDNVLDEIDHSSAEYVGHLLTSSEVFSSSSRSSVKRPKDESEDDSGRKARRNLRPTNQPSRTFVEWNSPQLPFSKCQYPLVPDCLLLWHSRSGSDERNCSTLWLLQIYSFILVNGHWAVVLVDLERHQIAYGDHLQEPTPMDQITALLEWIQPDGAENWTQAMELLVDLERHQIAYGDHLQEPTPMDQITALLEWIQPDGAENWTQAMERIVGLPMGTTFKSQYLTKQITALLRSHSVQNELDLPMKANSASSPERPSKKAPQSETMQDWLWGPPSAASANELCRSPHQFDPAESNRRMGPGQGRIFKFNVPSEKCSGSRGTHDGPEPSGIIAAVGVELAIHQQSGWRPCLCRAPTCSIPEASSWSIYGNVLGQSVNNGECRLYHQRRADIRECNSLMPEDKFDAVFDELNEAEIFAMLTREGDEGNLHGTIQAREHLHEIASENDPLELSKDDEAARSSDPDSESIRSDVFFNRSNSSSSARVSFTRSGFPDALLRSGGLIGRTDKGKAKTLESSSIQASKHHTEPVQVTDAAAIHPDEDRDISDSPLDLSDDDRPTAPAAAPSTMKPLSEVHEDLSLPTGRDRPKASPRPQPLRYESTSTGPATADREQAPPDASGAEQMFQEQPFVPPPLPSGISTSPHHPQPDDYVHLANTFQMSLGLRAGPHAYHSMMTSGDFDRFVGAAETVLAGGEEAQRLMQAQCVQRAMMALAHKTRIVNDPGRYNPGLAATLSQEAKDAQYKANVIGVTSQPRTSRRNP
ncbi:MAG: hypothetical protein J3Q66DRAFT_406982 [Benniella sp.]|nr:MAG: hypothetical protein J3Q66DRAFT_406982 [Benniella sp.]